MDKKLMMVIVLGLLIAGCSTISSEFQQPEIELVDIRPLPSQGLQQRFAIDLRILNTGRSPLVLSGIAYTLSLEGHKLVTGVAAEIPSIPAYGEQTITMEAGTSLVGATGFIIDLLQNPRQSVSYELDARLDLGDWRPTVELTESGTIKLGQND